jgi:hypothetical protein
MKSMPPLIPSRVLAWLVTATLALPVAICVLAGTARLLAAMGDTAGGAVLDRVVLAAGVIWVIILITLVIVLGILALAGSREPPEE